MGFVWCAPVLCEVQQLHAVLHSAQTVLHSPVYRCQKVSYLRTIKVDLQLASAQYYKRNTDIPEHHNHKRDRTSAIMHQGFHILPWKCRAMSTSYALPRSFQVLTLKRLIYSHRGRKGRRERRRGRRGTCPILDLISPISWHIMSFTMYNIYVLICYRYYNYK